MIFVSQHYSPSSLQLYMRAASDGAVCGRKAVETGREPLHVPAASHALAACSAAADGEDVRASRCGSRVHVD